MAKKNWEVTAHETLIHSWTVEAETEEEARELAGSGCPLLDGDCESAEFEIKKLKLEGAPEQVRDLIDRVEVNNCDCCESMISQVGCCCDLKGKPS